ncbi:uncharacterized protein LOC116849317 [Odontomachus brunneus]|uniref:uncharacterized protein LOC116849317 n=1 Tax=Odontomachus brunneus TaxID=486640 RepID=UPI0013F1FA8D|nr:uncharacterized protein LOC116849317 [Odontomachus brunneus]
MEMRNSAENINIHNMDNQADRNIGTICLDSTSISNNNVYNLCGTLELEQMKESSNVISSKEKSFSNLMSTSLPENSYLINDKTVNLYHQRCRNEDLQSTSRLQDTTDDISISPVFQSIMQKLENVSKQVHSIGQQVHLIGQQVNTLVSIQSLINDSQSIIQDLNLPISTREEYHEFNSDSKKLQILQTYLVTLGGLDLRGALNDFLKVTITDEFVARNITWKEGNNKLHFRESAISRTFFGAACRLVRLGPISFKEYCTEIKCTIKNATQRVYMSKVVRPRRKRNVEEIEKDAHLMQMYEAA